MLKQWTTAAALCVFGTAYAAATDANKASPTELDQIQGMDPAIAARIVEQRSSGPFKNWDDFMARIHGVGPASVAHLSAQGLTINGQAYRSEPPPPAARAASTPAKPAASTPSAITPPLPKPAKGLPAT